VSEDRSSAGFGQGASPIEWALAYASHGLDVFPCAANEHPLTPNGFLNATRDPGTLKTLWRRWPCAEPALAVPGFMVVVDLDRKNRKDGFQDFERLDGRDPLSVETPTATTPGGGLHLYFSAAKPYKNTVAIGGTGIDTRSEGGYVILPCRDNGRRWLRRLSATALAPAPDWLDCAAKQETSNSLFPRRTPAAPPPSSTLNGGLIGRPFLVRAVRLIMTAPQGAQEETRHRQAYFMGSLIAGGALDYEIAYRALVAAANAMPAHGKPWRNLEQKIAASLARGMEQAA
jgi:bifunctional DNA primase/polymerase-like protein